MASEKVQMITDGNFGDTVCRPASPCWWISGRSGAGPAARIAPTVDALAADYDGRAVVGKMNVDENPATPMQFIMRGIPTLLLFKGGAGGRSGRRARGKDPRTMLDKHHRRSTCVMSSRRARHHHRVRARPD